MRSSHNETVLAAVYLYRRLWLSGHNPPYSKFGIGTMNVWGKTGILFRIEAPRATR